MKAGSSSVIYKKKGEDWRRLGVPSRKLWSWIAGVQHAMRVATQKRMFGWNGILFGKEVITSSMTRKTQAGVKV